MIKANFPNEFFTLEMISITNIYFNPKYQAAIELAKTLEKDAQAAQKLQDIKEAEADAKVAEAEGKKQVAIKQAEAIAKTTKLLAEAEAYALEVKAKELTQMMIQNNMIDKWNGAYPQYMLGDSDMLMQLPVN